MAEQFMQMNVMDSAGSAASVWTISNHSTNSKRLLNPETGKKEKFYRAKGNLILHASEQQMFDEKPHVGNVIWDMALDKKLKGDVDDQLEAVYEAMMEFVPDPDNPLININTFQFGVHTITFDTAVLVDVTAE